MTTKLPQLNEKLISCVLEHIETHLDEYDQNRWCRLEGNQSNDFCGTTACVAGWAVLLTTPVDDWNSLPSSRSNLCSAGHDYYPQKAAELLGLTLAEAAYLFQESNCNARESLRIIKDRLAKIRKDRA